MEAVPSATGASNSSSADTKSMRKDSWDIVRQFRAEQYVETPDAAPPEGEIGVCDIIRHLGLSEQPVKAIVLSLVMMTFILSFLTVDFAFHPLLHQNKDLVILRLGSVTHNSAYLLIRHPTAKEALVKCRQVSRDDWGLVRQVNLDPNRDHTAVVKLSDLQAASLYEYVVLFSGGVVRQDVQTFKTFPDPDSASASSRFHFAFGSGVMCGFPYARPLDGIADMATHEPDFLLFLGNLVWTDMPWYHGSKRTGASVETTRAPYRQLFADPYAQFLFAAYPSFAIYGDHEIFDKWNGHTGAAARSGLRAWWEYIGLLNPAAADPADLEASVLHGEFPAAYFNFSHGTTAFFMLDTNRYRAPHRGDTMLGSEQLARLKQWLVDVNSTKGSFKFIGSSVPLTANRLGANSWSQQLAERDAILDFIAHQRIPNVVFLSGGMHNAAVIEIRPGVFEFSVAPLHGFYDRYPLQDLDLGEVVKYSHTNSLVHVGVILVEGEASPPHLEFRLFDGSGLPLYVQRVVAV